MKTSLPHHVLLAFTLAVLCATGCSAIKSIKLPRHVTVNELRPAPYNVGTTPDVAVIEVDGGRRDLQDATIEALAKHSRAGGFFIVEDRKAEGIRFDVRDGSMVLTGKPVTVEPSDVFIKVHVLDNYATDDIKQVVKKKKKGEDEVINFYETSMLLAFTAGTRDGVLMDQAEYQGIAQWKLGEHPGDVRTRYDHAAADAARRFLQDITPRNQAAKIKLDTSDDGQMEIIKAADRGSVKEAAVQMRSYAEQHPNSPVAWYNLAAMTDALGEYEEAGLLYDKAISLGGKPYYASAKTDCMRRMNEQRALEEASGKVAAKARTQHEAQTASASTEPVEEAVDLAQVQAALNDLGYDCGGVDGVMGPRTRSCIQAFQEENSLEATGAADAATGRKLRLIQ